MDVLRTGRSELHDIASRDIAPSDESVLKPRLTRRPSQAHVVSWVSALRCADLLCSAPFQVRRV